MKIPVEAMMAVWGAAIGAVALAIVGFSWGGWVTSARAERATQERVSAAVVGALAPICADKFRHASDASANLIALKKAYSWTQGDYVEKGGWATVVGTNSPEQLSAVAKACAQLLNPT